MGGLHDAATLRALLSIDISRYDDALACGKALGWRRARRAGGLETLMLARCGGAGQGGEGGGRRRAMRKEALEEEAARLPRWRKERMGACARRESNPGHKHGGLV